MEITPQDMLITIGKQTMTIAVLEDTINQLKQALKEAEEKVEKT